MKKLNMTTLKGVLLGITGFALVCAMAACAGQNDPAGGIEEILSDQEYSYVNPDETKAQPDAGFAIDGILDEEAYKKSNWLYLHNNQGGNDVNIAMTSHYGQKGIYLVFDVTETVPIYINLDRPSYMNSCIEIYLSAPHVKSMRENDVFEIDLMPTGDMLFKRSNGRDGYSNVATTDDIMACLGATTKGGEVNTKECYGYTMELFIPWDYLQWLEMDVEAIKEGFIYINPAHITSYNLAGTNTDIDRFWYHYIQQTGTSFSDVSRHFRFNGQGVMGGIPVTLEQGEHYTISGAPNVMPGMKTVITVKPDEGYALTSVMVNSEEQIRNISFQEDGSVKLTVLGTEDGVCVSAKAEAVTEGTKTLSGKIILNNIDWDSLDGVFATYIGPRGELPLDFDDEGNFSLTELAQGYYILKAEKKGYTAVSRSIFLNQNFYTELVLEREYFQVSRGSWVLDEQNDGVVYKKSGEGQLLSNASYNNFTFRANLKYDPELAKLGTGDDYTQQRTGIQIRFSNGKTWHIDMLKEKGSYILQYAKISGKNSVTDWKTIHTLNSWEASRYTGNQGIQLTVMRQGNYAAIWLDDQLIKIEVLDEQYDYYSAQLGFESWASNQGLLKIPFSIASHSTVDIKRSPFMDHAKTWNISGQYRGTIYKEGTKGVYTMLESVLVTNDVTVTAKDLTPEAKDYSLAYVFKFSNGEQFRVRLHHTDADGVYRVQSMNGSTVASAWKVGYDLTDEQADKIKGEGIDFRVKITGTTAYVYIGGQEACTYDLSKVVSSGKPSGIDMATAKVSFALDGNYDCKTEIPFRIVDNSEDVSVFITDVVNGTVIADKQQCKIGDSVTLTLAGDPGRYYTTLLLNGQQIDPQWDGAYRFKALENVYIVTAEFEAGSFEENESSAWNLLKQNQNLLYMCSHSSENSGWLSSGGSCDDFSATVKDHSPAAKDFSMVYQFDFSNGQVIALSLNHADPDGKYNITVAEGSTLAQPDSVCYTLSAEEAAKIKNDGIRFRMWIDGAAAKVSLDGVQVCAVDISRIVSTDEDSALSGATAALKLCMTGNLNQAVEIPFKLVDSRKKVSVNIESFTNGKVTADEVSYQLGDRVTLTILADEGYSQKLFINDQPIYLDWKNNTYSFEAAEEVYNITGSFEPSLDATAKDSNRWDAANQAHGILNAYYPNNDDAWLFEINGEYKTFSVKAKNYLSGEDGQGAEGFAVNIGFRLSNGSQYIFRVIRENGKYYHQRFGIGGNDWTKKELSEAEIAAICAEGAIFKLERTNANTLTLLVNGVVYDQYTMEGVTDQTKVTAVILGHYGNRGEKIQIPFALRTPADAQDVQIDISPTTGGSVSTAQQTYQTGDTVILVVSPEEGYSLKKLSVFNNGEPVAVSSSYSFVAESGNYVVEAEFEKSLFTVVSGNWDLSNQHNGTITITEQKDGTTVLTTQKNYSEVEVTVKDHTPSKNEDGTLKQGNFSMQISFIFDDGKAYQVRLHNTDKDGNYKLQNMGGTNSLTGWKWQADLTTAQKQKLLEGDGVSFGVKLVGSDAQLWVDGSLMKTVSLDSAYNGKLAQIKLCMNGNKGVENIEIPFTLTSPDDEVKEPLFTAVSGNWDLTQEHNGVLTITDKPSDGTTVQTVAKDYTEVSVTVKDHTPSRNEDGTLKQGNFSMQISFIFDDGKEYQVRLHNTDKDGNYKLQNMGGTNSLTGWKWQADLTTAQKQKLLEGDGVKFTVKLVGSDAQLWVDGTLMKTVSLGSAYEGKTAQIKLCMNGNKGMTNLEIPFELK